MRSPVIESSSAFAYPTMRGSSQLPPESGTRPIFTNAWVNDAASLAIRTSHANVSDAPAPAATPFTPAITGFGRSTMAWISRL